jgi:hypothetical protein
MRCLLLLDREARNRYSGLKLIDIQLITEEEDDGKKISCCA